MSAESGKAQPIYTSDSFRLAVDAMCEEWDEWAVENQGTRECFEAVLRKALAQIKPHPDPVRAALVEALDPQTLEAIADEIGSAEHSARAESLRGISRRQRAALKAAGEEV